MVLTVGVLPAAHAETLGSWSSTAAYPQLSVGPCVTYDGYEYCVSGYYASLTSSGIGTWTATNSYPLLSMEKAARRTTGTYSAWEETAEAAPRIAMLSTMLRFRQQA